MADKMPTIRVIETRDGMRMPALGIGTWRMGERAGQKKDEIAAIRIARGRWKNERRGRADSGGSDPIRGLGTASHRQSELPACHADAGCSVRPSPSLPDDTDQVYSLVLTVAGLQNGADELLVVDGATVALSDGKKLLDISTNQNGMGPPITYELDGKQYIALNGGQGQVNNGRGGPPAANATVPPKPDTL